MNFKLLLMILVVYESKFIMATLVSDREILKTKDSSVQAFRAAYAKKMKSYMNTSVDPCDDFYEYACGNYPNVIEDIELIRKQNSIYDLLHSTDVIIDEILQKKRSPNEQYYKELMKVKRYVEVCDSADILPLKPKEEYLAVLKTIGGFPAVDPTWSESEFDWFNMTAHLIRYGARGLVKEDIFMRYPFRPMYDIDKFGFGFDVYSDNIETDQSLGYVHNVQMMKRLLEIYGVTGAKANEVITEIIDFWRETVPLQNKAKDGCHEMDNDESEEHRFSKWNTLYAITMNLTNSSEIDSFPCPCDFYFNELDRMAKKRSKAFANYMALKFLYKMHPKVKSAKYQHQHCINQVKDTLPIVLTHFFIKEHFSEDVRKDIDEMIKELIKSFTALIKTTDWIDESTRFGLEDVLKILHYTIGRVVDPISDTYINEMNKLDFTDNYAFNDLELAKFKATLNYYIYKHSDTIADAVPFDILTAIMPNAFYDNTKHTINVLGGMLYPPIYHRDLPISHRYGGLGYIIGHEIVHSLDPKGKEHEKHFKPIHEWSNKSMEAMKRNSQCFIDHHNSVNVPELNIKLDGKQSLTETVCDSSGLRASFSTYKSLSNKFDSVELMPILDLTSDQNFFLNFAQTYCAKYEPRHYWSELYAGYPMDKYRVTLPLQNFDEFAKVFKCPLGSPMNPEKKCRMW